ncbi:MAG: serine hydroxymethyltransferase [Candidatus Nezhaarchaeota archaeon]|nr:serine hydroxymethyltransferase [Candidatus Nezhaarchaeota archaeon]
MNVEEASSTVLRVVKATIGQEAWRRRSTLNLIASENCMSPLARALLASDFNHRYAEGEPFNREYQGCRFIDQVESLCIELASKLFKARFVDVRPISGALANLAVFFAAAKPGDSMLSLSIPEGGHVSCSEVGAAGCRGLKVYPLPLNREDMTIDLDALARLIEDASPRIVTLGGSLILFPHPVREVKKLAEPHGCLVHYDAAHVLGLMIGGVFQDPLAEGADVVSGSTHKTFPGPQGGILLSNNEPLFRRVKKAVFPGLVSNHHLARLGSLAVTLVEMAVYGREYALQIVKNAKSLAKSLRDHGFEVLGSHRGFTESHQVALDVSSLGGGRVVSERLEQADIIVNRNLLPSDTLEKVHDPSGIRLGTQEVTRMGMREGEMERVAELISRLVLEGEEPELVKRDVHSLVSEFSAVKYSIDEPSLVKEVLEELFPSCLRA